jgi:hypothetical protein
LHRSIARCAGECAAVHEIADWLNKLGMSEYARRFVENRIDLSVLPDLTDQDLEKLGVVLGDRRKILRAIANLDNAPPAAAPASAPASVHPIAVTTAGPASEAALGTAMGDNGDGRGSKSRLQQRAAWRRGQGHGAISQTVPAR